MKSQLSRGSNTVRCHV